MIIHGAKDKILIFGAKKMYVRAIKYIAETELKKIALGSSFSHLLSDWSNEQSSNGWQTLIFGKFERGDNILRSLEDTLHKRSRLSYLGNKRSHPPLTTGICCILAYEAVSFIEEELELPETISMVPTASFCIIDASLATHTPSGKTFIYAIDQPAADAFALQLFQHLEKLNSSQTQDFSKYSIVSDVTSQIFKARVRDIQDRILAGDFFQANLTRMIDVDLGNSSRDQLTGFAERLLTQSQAPFGAILNFEEATVISASPERFFRIESTPEGRTIFAEPIKGTRPRQKDQKLDEALKQDLLSSEKDRAENIMIADLVRNDLSRVCTDESIIANPICELRSFANVHHLVTRVSGTLRKDVSNLEALLAQFPCGSITGAPKWAAMDAIAELEQRERGIYCGTIGYFDDRGHADFSVAIRTAVASFEEKGTTLTYGTGGGITILSDPEEEFTETEDKAAGFLRALQP